MPSSFLPWRSGSYLDVCHPLSALPGGEWILREGRTGYTTPLSLRRVLWVDRGRQCSLASRRYVLKTQALNVSLQIASTSPKLISQGSYVRSYMCAYMLLCELIDPSMNPLPGPRTLETCRFTCEMAGDMAHLSPPAAGGAL